MATVLLVRHGLTALTGPVLTGWTPGVGLDERGRKQASAVALRLKDVPLARIVSSPLDRCQETAGFVAAGREVLTDVRLGECRYGDWTGQKIADLAKLPLWKVVQNQPSAVVFPGPEGEALRDTQNRAVTAIREWDAKITEEFGAHAVWMACSHGDVIKAILADALGLHLDLFQRINVDTCSVSAVQYTDSRPFVLRQNDTGGVYEGWGQPPPPSEEGEKTVDAGDAVVGGGGR